MTDEDIIAYLLEELPEEDRERFEDECYAQENWPHQIDLVEEELIDNYLRDELEPEQRRRFEEYYLAPEGRRERVRIAAALLRHVCEYNASPEPVVVVPPAKPTLAERFRAFWGRQGWALSAATAVVVVAIIAGSLWAPFRNPSTGIFATLTLTISNSNRAEGVQAATVKLPPDAEGLNVSLMLPQPSPSAARYRVELENDSGETKSFDAAWKDPQSVLVMIPAAQLARGQRALKLFAVKPDGGEQRINGAYFFNVE